MEYLMHFIQCTILMQNNMKYIDMLYVADVISETDNEHLHCRICQLNINYMEHNLQLFIKINMQ